jgi:hypothetical protein
MSRIGTTGKRRSEMTRTAILYIAVSVSLFIGGTAYAKTTSDSGDPQTLLKRSTPRYKTPYARLEHSRTTDGAKEMTFEVLRMLSTGMTKAEVVSRAGHPQHTFQRGRSSTWVYSTTDHWIVELAFGGGRVSAINWTRP